jgi:hypothetical protein
MSSYYSKTTPVSRGVTLHYSRSNIMKIKSGSIVCFRFFVFYSFLITLS